MLAHQGVLGELVSQHLLPSKKISGQNVTNRIGKQSANNTVAQKQKNGKSPKAPGRRRKGRNKCRKRK